MGGENSNGGGTRARRARRGVEKNFLFEIRSPVNGTDSASEAKPGVPTADTNAPPRLSKRDQRGDAQLNSHVSLWFPRVLKDRDDSERGEQRALGSVPLLSIRKYVRFEGSVTKGRRQLL